MMRLGFSVDGVLDALNAQPHRSRGDGRTIMFIAARNQEGVTTAARAVAEGSGPGAVYGIDLDLKHNALARALMTHGKLGPKMDGRLSGASFYGVRAANGVMLTERAPAFSLHRVGQTRIYAGLFDPRALPRGGRVVISSAPHYWDAVRASGVVAVVDAPAIERSQVGLRVAPHMDGVVLVVGADAGAAPAAMQAKEALVNAGANLLGLVYAGATAPVMAIERLLRQAG
jgi:hypothetical protein